MLFSDRIQSFPLQQLLLRSTTHNAFSLRAPRWIRHCLDRAFLALWTFFVLLPHLPPPNRLPTPSTADNFPQSVRLRRLSGHRHPPANAAGTHNLLPPITDFSFEGSQCRFEDTIETGED